MVKIKTHFLLLIKSAYWTFQYMHHSTLTKYGRTTVRLTVRLSNAWILIKQRVFCPDFAAIQENSLWTESLASDSWKPTEFSTLQMYTPSSDRSALSIFRLRSSRMRDLQFYFHRNWRRICSRNLTPTNSVTNCTNTWLIVLPLFRDPKVFVFMSHWCKFFNLLTN